MWESMPEGWQIGGVGDFNGDGLSDILFRSPSGAVTVWYGAADSEFTGSWTDPIAQTADWQVPGIGDFNGDGRSDVLWRNADSIITDCWPRAVVSPAIGTM